MPNSDETKVTQVPVKRWSKRENCVQCAGTALSCSVCGGKFSEPGDFEPQD